MWKRNHLVRHIYMNFNQKDLKMFFFVRCSGTSLKRNYDEYYNIIYAFKIEIVKLTIFDGACTDHTTLIDY